MKHSPAHQGGVKPIFSHWPVSLLLLLSTLLVFCGKEESIEIGKQSNSQWEFTERDKRSMGSIDTAYLDTVSTGKTLVVLGTSTEGKAFSLHINHFNNKAGGTYKSPDAVFSYSLNTTLLYQSDLTGQDDFTVTVLQIDARSISGTFQGNVRDSAGAGRQIVNGRFHTGYYTPDTTGPVTGTPLALDSGNVAFWSKSSCSGGSIRVKVGNLTGQITGFTTVEPADCSTAGSASFRLPAGNYSWTSYCGTDSITGTVAIAKGTCTKKEVAFVATPAQFTLSGTPGNCASANVQGKYVAGKPLDASNKVTISVNVTAPGKYSISTTTVNNMTFSSAGTFTAAGVQTVNLGGQGQPASVGTSQFPVNAGSSTCGFTVTIVADSGSTATGPSAWSFTEGTKSFQGDYPNATSATFSDDYILADKKSLHLYGATFGGDTTMDIYIQLPGTATQPIPGTYNVDPNPFSVNSTNFTMYTGFPPNAQSIYEAQAISGILANIHMTITITAFNSATKMVTGTFAGNAWDKNGKMITISKGMFKATVSQ